MPRRKRHTLQKHCQSQSKRLRWTDSTTAKPKPLLFDALTSDVIYAVLSHLDYVDVLCLHWAIDPVADESTKAALSAEMRSRVLDLQHLWTLMDYQHVCRTFANMMPPGWTMCDKSALHGKDIRPASLGRFVRRSIGRTRSTLDHLDDQFPLSPSEIVEKLQQIWLRDIDVRAARTLAREFWRIEVLFVTPTPDELAQESVLSTRANCREMEEATFAEIGKLTRLQKLELEYQNMTRLPATLLSGLSQLEQLSITGNPGIHALPSEIGLWLPSLRVLRMELIYIDSVPESLVHTMVANYTKRVAFWNLQSCIYVSDFLNFEFWRHQLRPERFSYTAADLGVEPDGNPWWLATLIRSNAFIQHAEGH